MSKAAAVKETKEKNSKVSIARSVVAFVEKGVGGARPLGYQSGTFPHHPTNIIQIDHLIGGDLAQDKKSLICPGLPKARIMEVFGAESSGKTSLALKFAVSVQKAGGVVMYLDYEHALHHGYAKTIGVDFDPEKFLLYTPNTFEDGMKMAYIAIKQGVSLVIFDSVSAMVPASELHKKLDEVAKIGALARAMSDVLAKMVQWLDGSNTSIVFINQTRALISKMSYGGGEDNTSGGKALKFYSSIRLKLTRIKSEFVEKADPLTLRKKRIPYGNLVNVKCVKNRLAGKQGHTSEIFIRFGFGVDEFMSLIESSVPRKIIEKSKGGYAYGKETFRGREALRKWLMLNPKACDEIRGKVAKAFMSESPEPLVDDEVEDDDILSDMTKEFGDDDLAEAADSDQPESEEIVEEEPEQS